MMIIDWEKMKLLPFGSMTYYKRSPLWFWE